MAHILIVEDDRASARLLSLLIKKGGHESTAAHSLAAARQWLQERPEFDLIILDNRLQDNYGWELLVELRRHFFFAGVPVLVYTAAGDRESVSRYVELGVQNIRTKPYAWDVIRGEIEKAVRVGWRHKDIDPPEKVVQRLQISLPEYYLSLRELGVKLQEAANQLLELLTPSKERQFLHLLNELRSHAVNFGIGAVLQIIRECVEAFRAGDWSRAVKSVRTFDILACRLEYRVRVFEEAEGPLETASDDAFDFSEPPPEGSGGVGGSNRLGQLLASEVPPIFRRMATAFAQGDTVEMLVRKCVRGAIPASKYEDCLAALGDRLSWLAFLEPSDLEPVADIVREVPELEARLRAFPAKGRLSAEPLREVVGHIGVFQSGFLAATLGARQHFRDRDFPVRMDFLVLRQLLTAELVRVIAARIQRPVNLEAVVWLQFLGEWVFATRYPGVYALVLLDASQATVRKHRTAFQNVRRTLTESLNLPGYCREALHVGKLEGFVGQGASRLSLALYALAEQVMEAHGADQAGLPTAPIRKEFENLDAWHALADEKLRLPQDRGRFFEALLGKVPALLNRIDAILGNGSAHPAPTGPGKLG